MSEGQISDYVKDWAQVFSTYRLMQTLKYLREPSGIKKQSMLKATGTEEGRQEYGDYTVGLQCLKRWTTTCAYVL